MRQWSQTGPLKYFIISDSVVQAAVSGSPGGKHPHKLARNALKHAISKEKFRLTVIFFTFSCNLYFWCSYFLVCIVWSVYIVLVLPLLRIHFIILAEDPTRNGKGTPFPTPHSVLSTPPCCTWRRPCARMKMRASTNFTVAVCLYFRHRRVCSKRWDLQWVHVRWVYELTGQLRMYLYGWIHWRRIQLHRCVSVFFLFNINEWFSNESSTNR